MRIFLRLLSQSTKLWTRDKKLRSVAAELDLIYEER
jgi:hypothetical protein